MKWFAVVRPYGPTVYVEGETYSVMDGVLRVLAPWVHGKGVDPVATFGSGGWGMIWEVSAEQVSHWVADGKGSPVIRQPERMRLPIVGESDAD